MERKQNSKTSKSSEVVTRLQDGTILKIDVSILGSQKPDGLYDVWPFMLDDTGVEMAGYWEETVLKLAKIAFALGIHSAELLQK